MRDSKRKELPSFLSLLIFTILSITSLFAQDFTVQVQQISVEDGLLHRDVQTVFEDKNGIIWIGGINGVQRYDGHSFKTWTKADRTKKLYYISAIEQDDAGWLWLPEIRRFQLPDISG